MLIQKQKMLVFTQTKEELFQLNYSQLFIGEKLMSFQLGNIDLYQNMPSSKVPSALCSLDFHVQLKPLNPV